jgi:RNA polymerase sigma-70 factor, ECF subfamily
MQARTGATVAMRRSGGTGRRAGLKIRWGKPRVGSSPTFGISGLFGSTKPQPGGSYSQRLPHSEDTELLAEIESLYRDRFADFVAVAASIVGERESAREAVQDAFASVVRGRRGFRRSAPLEAWVWQVVINAARKKRQRSAPDVPMEMAASPSPNGSAPEPREMSELAVLVAALPERQRLVLFLRHYADLDYREIARILGVKTGTVSASLHAAHATLRRTLSEVET